SFFTIYSSLAFTYRTFGCDGRSFAITGWTGSDGLHLSEERILHSSYLAAATTGSTGLNASFILCATPIAGVASDVFFYFDILGNTLCDFLVCKLEFNAKITSPDTASSLAAAAALAATKKVPEQVIAEYIS